MFVCGYGHMGAGAFRGQRHKIPLGLLLQVVVSCLAWLLGLERRATERTYVLLSSDLGPFFFEGQPLHGNLIDHGCRLDLILFP